MHIYAKSISISSVYKMTSVTACCLVFAHTGYSSRLEIMSGHQVLYTCISAIFAYLKTCVDKELQVLVQALKVLFQISAADTRTVCKSQLKSLNSVFKWILWFDLPHWSQRTWQRRGGFPILTLTSTLGYPGMISQASLM